MNGMEFDKLRILANDEDEFLLACKTKLICQAVANGHQIIDIVSHLWHDSGLDISYLLYCVRCPYEITLEYAALDDMVERLNIVGETETPCPRKT